MEWKLLHPKARYDMLGFLPEMMDSSNPNPAKDQLHQAYGHGGGWDPFKGFTLNPGERPSLSYPGDLPMVAIGETYLRDERIVLFESSWVAIIQKDGSFEVSRMD